MKSPLGSGPGGFHGRNSMNEADYGRARAAMIWALHYPSIQHTENCACYFCGLRGDMRNPAKVAQFIATEMCRMVPGPISNEVPDKLFASHGRSGEEPPPQYSHLIVWSEQDHIVVQVPCDQDIELTMPQAREVLRCLLENTKSMPADNVVEMLRAAALQVTTE